MRKLSILCRKVLRTTGRDYCVIRPRDSFGPRYKVYWRYINGSYEYICGFSTVSECEAFFLSLFR